MQSCEKERESRSGARLELLQVMEESLQLREIASRFSEIAEAFVFQGHPPDAVNCLSLKKIEKRARQHVMIAACVCGWTEFKLWAAQEMGVTVDQLLEVDKFLRLAGPGFAKPQAKLEELTMKHLNEVIDRVLAWENELFKTTSKALLALLDRFSSSGFPLLPDRTYEEVRRLEEASKAMRS